MRQNSKRPLRRLLSVILALTLVFSLAPAALAEGPPFSDLDGNWAQASVLRWAQRGIIRGNNGQARPDDPITRAEAATMLNRVFGYQDLEEAQFDDVPADAWYRDDLLRLHTAGVMQGDEAGNMRPNARITRQESAAILFRAFGLEVQAATEAFTDAGDIAAWARPSVNTMAALGYLHGYPNGDGSVRFQPRGEITRAEFITVLDNMAAEFYHDAKTYPAQTVRGNAILRTPGVRLQDVTVEGDLYLAEGLGDGDATLEGLRADRLIVRAGGVHSVYFEKSLRLGGITVTEGAVPVSLKFPLAWQSQVRDYFGGENGVEIATDRTHVIVTFTAPFESDKPFSADGKTNGGSGGSTGGGGGRPDVPDVPDVPDPPVGQESAIGDPVTAVVANSGTFLSGRPQIAMQPAYTRSGNTIAASGRLAKATGLSGPAFGGAAEEGYFAVISIPLPLAAESAVRTADGAVLTISGSGWIRTFDKDDINHYLHQNDMHDWRLEFALYIASSAADTPRSYTMALDFDGSGNTYRSTAYTLDFSGVTLLAADVPFDKQKAELKTDGGFNSAHTAAGVTLSGDDQYVLDAATLEGTLGSDPNDLNLLKTDTAYAAHFVLKKPDSFQGTPASVAVTVNGQAVATPTLAADGSFELALPLTGTNAAYLPRAAYAIGVEWKDAQGATIGISQVVLSRQTKFTVTFDYQDTNMLNPDNKTVTSGGLVTLPDPVNKSDKSATVVGWCLDQNCTQDFDPQTPVTSNLTLYAKWGLPAALQAMVDQFTGNYTANVEDMTITPEGVITFKSNNITIPAEMQLTVDTTIQQLIVQNGSTLQINGTLRVEDKTISVVASLTSASMSLGGDGLLSIASKSQQEQKYIGGINYLLQQTLRSGEGPVFLNDAPEQPPQMIASEDAVIRLGGTTVYFDTGTIYVTESFYYIHSDNRVTVNKDAEVILLHDMILHGKLYLHGKITPTEGFKVIADESGGSSSGTGNARVYVDRAGVNLSAFTLADDVRNVSEEGLSAGPVALKWDMDNLNQSRWINAVGDLGLVMYTEYHDSTGSGNYVYMYECTGGDANSACQINLYENEADETPMTLPADGSIVAETMGIYPVLGFAPTYKEKTYYLEVEQYGVKSLRVKIVVGLDSSGNEFT